jgi:hypothetical protein
MFCEHCIQIRQCLSCGGHRAFYNRMARSAKSTLKAFLRKVLKASDIKPKKYGEVFSLEELKFLILDRRITNKKLARVAKRYGWPDFRKEALEEKGPRQDWLNESQWARAILEYRSGRKYKVAWRFTSTRRKVFQTVFDFFLWQQTQERGYR